MQFVLQAFEKDLQLNVRKAIQLYNILYSTLFIQINNVSTYTTTIANLQKLTTLEKEVVVREVFDLDSRGFPLWIYDIKDIANRLLATYNTTYVGPRWTFNFVK